MDFVVEVMFVWLVLLIMYIVPMLGE